MTTQAAPAVDRAPTAPRARVVLIAEGAIPTGFARVTTSVFSRLASEYDLRQLTPHPLPEDRPAGDPPWSIAPLRPFDRPASDDDVLTAVACHRPRVVWILADLQIAREYVRILQRLRADGTRLVTYCPVDLTPLPPDMVAPLAGADAIVAYTEYGRTALSNALATACSGGSPPPRVHVIPHGLDASVFFPVDRSHARLELLGDGHRDDFIVLNANRNQPRKRIDTTVRGFALFSQGKPAGVRLHLHMGMLDRGWDVPALVRRHGLEERVIFTTDSAGMPFVSSSLLNLVYNAADVGVNTSTTEGWGLVSFEHAATGVAQVLPGHSVFQELWEGAATLIAPRVSLTRTDGLFDEHYVAAEDVATALERLYGDHDHRRRMAAAAFANATQPRYSWDHVGAMWRRLLGSVIRGLRGNPESSE